MSLSNFRRSKRLNNMQSKELRKGCPCRLDHRGQIRFRPSKYSYSTRKNFFCITPLYVPVPSTLVGLTGLVVEMFTKIWTFVGNWLSYVFEAILTAVRFSQYLMLSCLLLTILIKKGWNYIYFQFHFGNFLIRASGFCIRFSVTYHGKYIKKHAFKNQGISKEDCKSLLTFKAYS